MIINDEWCNLWVDSIGSRMVRRGRLTEPYDSRNDSNLYAFIFSSHFCIALQNIEKIHTHRFMQLLTILHTNYYDARHNRCANSKSHPIFKRNCHETVCKH